MGRPKLIKVLKFCKNHPTVEISLKNKTDLCRKCAQHSRRRRFIKLHWFQMCTVDGCENLTKCPCTTGLCVKHRNAGKGNPRYKDGKYTRKCTVCNAQVLSNDPTINTCQEHTFRTVEWIHRCIELNCDAITSGPGRRCTTCSNTLNTSKPEFKQACSERMNIRVKEPGYKEMISQQVKQRYLEHPEQWAKPKGKDSHLYIDGSSIRGYIGFNERLKLKIRERDNNECQLCSRSNDENWELFQHRLACHHIDYDKTHSTSDNLIALCTACHGKTNKKQDRSYWQSYFQTNFAQQLGVLI